MQTVRKLLDQKDHDVWTVGPDDFIFSALQLMASKGIGAVVVAEDGKPIGIFSERDYARNVILKGKSSPKTPIREVMTTPIHCARPEQTVEECMALMTEKHIRHLPILEDEKLVGIISIGDLVKSVIADQKITIEQLEQYIRGG